MVVLRVAKIASFIAKKAFKNKTFQKVIFNVLKDYGFKMLNDKLSDNDSEPKSVNFELEKTIFLLVGIHESSFSLLKTSVLSNQILSTKLFCLLQIQAGVNTSALSFILWLCSCLLLPRCFQGFHLRHKCHHRYRSQRFLQ